MMDGERVTVSHFSGKKHGPPFEVHVLVVDDDATTLQITLGILTSLNYGAEGINHTLLALERLKEKEGSFDLIVMDLHLPPIDGFKFKQTLDQQFPLLPLIMISVDNKEGVMEKALMSGVVRYIVKPATPNDFEGIWQFAKSAIKGKKSSSSSLAGSVIRRSEQEEDISVEDLWEAQSNINITKHHGEDKMIKRKDYVVRAPWKDNNNNKASSSSSSLTKKTKVVWTNDLQNRFLEAINIIGLEKAVPKKILEVMKTPGLTRENVASHLQKYRLFLKRVARMFALVMNNVTDKDVLLTSLASKYPSLMLKNIQEEYRRIIKHSKMQRTTSNTSSYNLKPSHSCYEPSKLRHRYNPSISHRPHYFSSKTNPIFPSSKTTPTYPYGSVNYSMPASASTSSFSSFNNNNARSVIGELTSTFEEMNQIQRTVNNGVSISNTFECGYNDNSLINDWNYSYLNIEGGLCPTRANQTLEKCMEGNNAMEHILEKPLYEQQEVQQQNQFSNEEDDCYGASEIGNYNDASHVTSQYSLSFYGIIDECRDNFNEGDNSKFCTQHENKEESSKEGTNYPTDFMAEVTTANGDASKQEDQEVSGNYIDPRVESDDHFPSFVQFSDQDWEDDFMESLFNNKA